MKTAQYIWVGADPDVAVAALEYNVDPGEVACEIIAHDLNPIRVVVRKPVKFAFAGPHETSIIRADGVDGELTRPVLRAQNGHFAITRASSPAAAIGQPDVALLIRTDGVTDIFGKTGLRVVKVK